MGMILQVGGFSFPLDSMDVERGWVTLMSAQRRPYAEKHTWVCKGRFIADGAVAVSSLGRQAEAALRRQYQDVIFKHTNGQVIYSLPNSTSTDGVKVTQFRNPVEPGILATLLPFEFTAEATYPYTGIGIVVLEYQESLAYAGGGPRIGFTECVNADPVKFITARKTVAKATQQGVMRTIGGRGTYPQPVFLADLLPSETEKAWGKAANSEGVIEYSINWKYQFAASGFTLV